jgi:hypothetical protein
MGFASPRTGIASIVTRRDIGDYWVGRGRDMRAQVFCVQTVMTPIMVSRATCGLLRNSSATFCRVHDPLRGYAWIATRRSPRGSTFPPITRFERGCSIAPTAILHMNRSGRSSAQRLKNARSVTRHKQDPGSTTTRPSSKIATTATFRTALAPTIYCPQTSQEPASTATRSQRSARPMIPRPTSPDVRIVMEPCMAPTPTRICGGEA